MCFQQQLLSQFVVRVEIESMFPLIPKTGRKCLLIGIKLGLIKIKCCLKNPVGLQGISIFIMKGSTLQKSSSIDRYQELPCFKGSRYLFHPRPIIFFGSIRWVPSCTRGSFPKKAFDEFIAREMTWKIRWISKLGTSIR